MSRRFLFSAALAAATAATPAAAQTQWTFSEVTRSGAVREMGTRARAVDVNSSVRVRIDRDALHQAVGGALLPPGVLLEVRALTEALRGTDQALAELPAAQAAYVANPGNPRTRAALLAALKPLGTAALAITRSATPGSELRERLNAALEAKARSPREEQYAAVFSTATAYVAELQRDVDSVATQPRAQPGMRLRMGAWLVNDRGSREVHLPGFDTVRTQAPSVVPTYQIFLTEEQAAQFRALAAEARALREKTDASPFADVSALRDRLQRIAAEGLACAESLPAQFASLAPAGQLAQFQQANQSIVQKLRELQTRYGSGVAVTPELVAAAPADAMAVLEAARAWLSSMNDLLSRASATAGSTAAAARTAVESCRGTVQTRLESDLAPLVAALRLDPARRLAVQSLEFSDRVLSLDIGSVPEQTELSLITAGTREPGDQLAFRMTAVDATGHERILASQSFLVERTEPHIHLSVAMIWAWRDPPIDEEGNSRGNQWHPAPGYSILAKRVFFDRGLARRFPFYAEVLSPGIGLNLSAPDFDLNDTPEFAAGIVFSIFRDYVQAGYSYNFQKNHPFPFIGIRLPLPSATLPATETGPQN